MNVMPYSNIDSPRTFILSPSHRGERQGKGGATSFACSSARESLVAPESNRERFRDQTCLFALMKSEGADGGAGTGIATGITNFAAEHGAQARLDETPCPHVLRFFLAPNQSCFLRKNFNRRAQLFLIQRIELFDADNRAVGDFFFFAMGNKIEIDFSGAKNDALDFVSGISDPG